MSVGVRLRSGVPEPGQSWDAARALGERLRSALGLREVAVTVNANRSRMLAWKNPTRDTLQLSVHHSLLPAPDDVLAVVERRDASALQRLRSLHRPSAPKPPALTFLHHDLAAVRVAEDARLAVIAPAFDTTTVPVGWGRWPTRPPRRSLRLGSLGGSPPVARIHPVLDHDSVPSWFVGFVIFHELLHAAFPPQTRASGRRSVHTAAFSTAERSHVRFADAALWEEQNVSRLIRRVQRRVARLSP